MGVYVLIPAFNEAGKLGPLLADMPDVVDEVAVTVVVIDDGSTDATASIAKDAGVEVLQNDANLGKGAALCRGMEELRSESFEAMVWMDGDGQHLPQSLAELTRPVLDAEADLCVGSRYLANQSMSRAPLNRRIVRRSVVRAVTATTGFEVTDPFSGYRAFSEDAARIINLQGCGYECELESVFAVARASMRYQEVAIPRIYGPDTSKMGYRRGAFRGRIDVLRGYGSTVVRGWRNRNKQIDAPIHV